MGKSSRWPIHWIEVPVILPGRKRAKKTTFGICGKTRQVMRVGASTMTMLIVNDLYVDEDAQHCEEGRRCLNTTCSLNHTTVKTLMAHFGMKRRPAWLKEVKPIEVEGLQETIDRVCEKHPDHGAIGYME